MKHLIAACILLLPVISANAKTAMSDLASTERPTGQLMQQSLRHKTQLSGYLFTSPSAEKATIDSSAGEKHGQSASRQTSPPAPEMARIPQPGNSGARAQ